MVGWLCFALGSFIIAGLGTYYTLRYMRTDDPLYAVLGGVLWFALIAILCIAAGDVADE